MELMFPKNTKKKKTKYEKYLEYHNRQIKKQFLKRDVTQKKQRNKIAKRLDDGSKFRKNVRERDNFICALCGRKYKPNEIGQDGLVVHHVKGRGKYQFVEKYAISLCGDMTYQKCHKVVHSNNKKYKPILLEKLDNIYKERQ